MVSIFDIEKAVKIAFKKTVKDYRSDKIELEEDCRACFYHYMRPFINKNKELQMLLSHNVNFKKRTIKPDIFIFRHNVYLFAIEIKSDTKQASYSKEKGRVDIKRLKSFSGDIQRGCFMHFDLKDFKYRHQKQDWQNNYYIELYHINDSNKTMCYEVKQNVAKHYPL